MVSNGGLFVGKRGAMWRGYALIAPLLLFLMATFLAPAGLIAWRSVADPEMQAALPATAKALAAWNGEGVPGPETEAALASDLKAADRSALASLSRRLSYEDAGFRALLQSTKRALDGGKPLPLAALNPKWDDNGIWQIMKRAVGPAGSYHLLSAFDLKHDYVEGVVAARDGGLYRSIIVRTFAIALMTSVITLLIAFPLCAFLLRQTPRVHNLLLLMVLLPFWTSILVRTTSWLALLQDRGVINTLLMDLGLIDAPFQLLYNRFGVVVALVHVMLPFMIFPLLSNMRSIDARLYRAALSLGATPVRAFFRVYLPQAMPGMMAGTLMVFVVTLGFYITPMLVGGPADQMISYYIALFTTGTLNWGLASSLGLILLTATMSLYALQNFLASGSNGQRR